MFQYQRIFADEAATTCNLLSEYETEDAFQQVRQAEVVATDELAGQIAAAARRLLQETGMNLRELAINAKVPFLDLTGFMQKPKARVLSRSSTIEKALDKYLAKKAGDLAAGRMNDFIETPVSEAIFGVVDCLLCQEEAGISVARMDTGLGKSMAVMAKMNDVQGCVYLSVSVTTGSQKGFLASIGRKVGLEFSEQHSRPYVMGRVVEALRGCPFLIIDEFHQLAQRRCDDCVQILTELAKEHGIRQLWVSTMNVSRYIDKRANRWGNLLSQTRRHFSLPCDSDDLRDASGAIFKKCHIAKMLAGGRMGLDDEAMRYMVKVANKEQEGGLGLMKKVYPVALGMALATGAAVIDRDMLGAACERVGGRAMRQTIEADVARETTAPVPAAAKRMVG